MMVADRACASLPSFRSGCKAIHYEVSAGDDASRIFEKSSSLPKC